MRDYKAGDRLEIETKEGKYVGILMERPELADDKHVVIKLDSGYNIGIRKDRIAGARRLQPKPGEEEYKAKAYKEDKSKRNISILATGGTIASRVDYITGGVHSAFSAEDLISAVPELESIANVSGRQIFNKFSENMAPQDWVRMAEETYREVKEGSEGVVITHGTDTMGYTAAALSFMLKSPAPVILTGAQRSSDRGSSDAAMNLMHAAVAAATPGFSGVYVLMHAESSDSCSSMHPGTRVKKMHSSRRDAFKTVNAEPAAKVSMDGVCFSREQKREEKLEIDARIDEAVYLLKYAPGLKPNMVKAAADLGYKGLVVEGTGLGHTSDELALEIKAAIDSGLHVAMTTQTVYGRVNLNVYSTGRKLLASGVIGCEDMLSETAYVKMMWVLGHTKKAGKVKEFMLANTAGELSEKTTYQDRKSQ